MSEYLLFTNDEGTPVYGDHYLYLDYLDSINQNYPEDQQEDAPDCPCGEEHAPGRCEWR